MRAAVIPPSAAGDADQVPFVIGVASTFGA
jgi:hypothetical protein